METAAQSDDVRGRRVAMMSSQSAEIRERRCRGHRDAALRGEAMTSRERTAAARQRGDKTRTPSAAPPDAALGRLCEAQWLSVLAAEERDDVVGDAVAELLGAVVERCFQAELARQCVPFAVSQARAELLRAAAWRFPVRDEGDAELEAAGAWQEDEEPPPGATEAWAEGAVPILRVCPAAGHGEVSSTDTDAVPSEAEGGGVPLPSPTPSVQDEVLDAPQPSEGSGAPPVPALLPAPLSRSTARPRRLPGIKHPGPRLWAEISDAAEAEGHGKPQPPSCSDLIAMWARKSLRSEGWACDRRSAALLHPSTLRIRPHVEVLEPGTEIERQSRPLRHRRQPRGPSGQDVGPGASRSPRGLAAVEAPRLLPPIAGAGQPGSSRSPVLGSLLGTVRLAPGVTIRHGGSEGRGLRLPVRREDAEEETGEAKRDLRPLRPTVPFPAIAVSQVTGDGTP
ncbi:LOW QUALITY PROTEIN: uncharacterized protein C2orf81 homolog [Centrocercus urophasianus]|uniref:LOW QUALITY PROTEIN: uncharacterized protein C2orf81 homolog n=1 Tax=Centrocercus urophasianus TaxID=9002 RepID=UPI001C647E91|nr:LOW QUALITY PROTEIN: uncharacterized protein C2orf81 homolog [Centrocercus urophasianus]